MTLVSETADGPQRGRAYLFLTLTTLFWAGNVIAARIAVGEVSPKRWWLVLHRGLY